MVPVSLKLWECVQSVSVMDGSMLTQRQNSTTQERMLPTKAERDVAREEFINVDVAYSVFCQIQEGGTRKGIQMMMQNVGQVCSMNCAH